MSIIDKMLRYQTAMYWEPGPPDVYGQTTLQLIPEPLNVRWEDSQVLYINPLGQEKTSLAVVYVSADVEPGGWLLLGDADDILPGLANNPRQHTGAFEIKQFTKLPTLRQKKILRTAFL